MYFTRRHELTDALYKIEMKNGGGGFYDIHLSKVKLNKLK
jgi:transcriptional regulator CtsR